MLENRSFDHMLGFSQISGTDAVNGNPTRIDGLSGSEQNPSPNGGIVTVSSDAGFVMNADPGHEYTDVREQLCGRDCDYSSPTPAPGNIDANIKNNGYVSSFAAKYPSEDPSAVMRCFTPERLPVLMSLAKEFAICDHWFSSMPGPTWPNRFFLHAATAGGLDHSPSLPKEIVSMTGDAYKFDNGTIFDLLDSEKIDWAIYCGDEFPQALHMQGMVDNLEKGRFHAYSKFRNDLQEGDFSKSYVFIEPDWHPFTHFRCGNSQHPVDDVTRGERFLKEIYEAVRNSPVWEKSLLIITYDEHGGFFDHVSPPTTVDPGDQATSPYNNKYGCNFRQLGVRVPAVLVSPFIAKGVIDHTIYEHCSVLTTVEKTFGLGHLTERDKRASDLTHLLSVGNPRTDAPKSLPNPIDSGIKCTPEFEFIAEAQCVLENLLTSLHLKTAKPVDPALCGFIHIALLKKLSTTAPNEKDHVISEALKIQSEKNALRYLRHARRQTRMTD